MLCKVINGALRHDGVRYPRGAEVELSQERCEALVALGVVSVKADEIKIEAEAQEQPQHLTNDNATDDPQQVQQETINEAPSPKTRRRGRRKKQ